MLLPGIGRLPVARQQELRVILTARNMAEGGDWLIPHFVGQPRLRKPPLMYWIVASTFRLLDPSTVSSAVARLPTVVFGTLLIFALYGCGRDFVGRRRAFIASLLAATTYLFIRHAQIAETDIPLTLFVLLASWSGFRAMQLGARLGWWVAAGAFAGLGFMIKGPAAIALPLLAWCMYLWTTPSARAGKPVPRILLVVCICAAIVLPWYIEVFFHNAQATVARAQVGTELDVTLAESSHHGTIFYYMIMLPETLMPWGLLLPFALVGLWCNAWHHRGPRFLLGWLVSSFAMLSVISSKQEHYSTLLLPASVLMLGWFVGRGQTLVRGYVSAVLGLLIVGGAALAAYPLYVHEGQRVAVSLAGAFLVILCAAAWRRRETAARLLAVACSMALASAVYAMILFEQHDPRTVFAAFARQADSFVKPGEAVYVAGPHKAVMEYYLHRHLVRNEEMAAAFQQAGSNDFIVATCNKQHPMDAAPANRHVLVELQKKDIRCVLYGKIE